MPQIEYNGEIHEFPDDFSEADIASALSGGQSRTSSGNEEQDIATQQGSAHLLDVAKGIGKGALNTVYQGGDLIRRGLGMERIVDTPAVQEAVTPSNVEQGIGTTMETMAEMAPLGVMAAKGVAAIPGIVTRGLGINKARAAANLGSAASAAKDVVLNVEGPGQAAMRITELGERGASVPRVVQTFLRRITDPSKGPLTFEEARDYYSNISRLSANEYSRLNPTVQRQVGEMRHALNQALTGAAGQVGKGDEYASGIREYAKAMKAEKTASTVGKSAAKGAAGVVGAAGAYSLLQRIMGN